MQIQKKKLLLITSEYFHPLTTRLHRMLPLLSENFDIRILAITYSKGNQSTSKSTFFKIVQSIVYTFFVSIRRPEQNNNIIILRYPFPENRIMTQFGGLFESLFIAWLLKLRKLGKGFDVCLAAPVLAGFSTLFAKMPMPIIFEDWDRFQYCTNHLLSRKFISFMENYCIRNSEEVVSAGFALASSAEEERKKQVYCIPNGVDLNLFKAKNQGFFKDRFAILYVGTISEWSGLEVAIQAIPKIVSKWPKAQLVIIGKGEERFIEKLRRLAINLGISEHVVFMGSKEYKDLPNIMKNFGLGLATFPNIPLMKYAFTLKLPEYMAAGLPLIATDVGDTGTIVRKANCGLIVEYSPSSIAKAVNRLFKDINYAESLAYNGQKWVENLDLEHLVKVEIDLLMKLAEKDSNLKNSRADSNFSFI